MVKALDYVDTASKSAFLGIRFKTNSNASPVFAEASTSITESENINLLFLVKKIILSIYSSSITLFLVHSLLKSVINNSGFLLIFTINLIKRGYIYYTHRHKLKPACLITPISF